MKVKIQKMLNTFLESQKVNRTIVGLLRAFRIFWISEVLMLSRVSLDFMILVMSFRLFKSDVVAKFVKSVVELRGMFKFCSG